MKKRTMPYGYEIRNGEITVDQDASKVIKEVFEAYLDGMSFAQIAAELTAQGIDYYEGKTQWNKLMVKRILECSFYLGTAKYPRIINHEQFESANTLISEKYGGYNKDPRATILKKRTFCQECGERITRDIQSTRYFAQAESESISKNVTWGVRHAFSEGKVTFTHDIYGYKKEYNPETKRQDKISIVEDEATVIREIFERYYAGDSLTGICTYLNNNQIVPPGKKKDRWYPSTLQTILRNEKYKGDVLTQKTFCSDLLSHKREKNNGQLAQHYLENHHEAIIDRELFDKVQAEYARRNAKKVIKTDGTQETQKKGRYNSKYALTDILVCGHCGAPYRRCVWTHHGSRKVVWRCTTRMDYGKEKCNDSFTIEEEGLHQAILKAISNLSSRKEELKDELKAALSITLLDTGADMSITSLEQQIKEQENDLMRVVRITAERGNKGEFETEFKRISDNIKDLKRLLEVEKTKIRPKLDIESRLEDLFTTIDRANVDVKEFNNQIIRQLIAQIRIDNESKMTVILTNGYRFEAEL